MKRSAFQRKAPPRLERPDRSAEFASWRPRSAPASTAVIARDIQAAAPVVVAPRIEGRIRQDIRDSARDEECTVRIVGVCRGGTEHTIWSHAPLQAAGKGRGIKAIDYAGAFACTACDAVVDGQAPLPPGATRESVLLDWFMGHMRSLVRLAQKGLLR